MIGTCLFSGWLKNDEKYMDLFEGTNVHYIQVLTYSCDSGEGVRKVIVNREEGMHTHR